MQNHYIIHKTILRSSHSLVEYGTPTSLKAPLEGSWRLSRLWGGFFIFSIAISPSLRDTTLPSGRPTGARYPIYFPLGRPTVTLLPYTKIPQSPHLPLQTATKYSIIKKLHIEIERSHNKWNKRKKIKWVQCL